MTAFASCNSLDRSASRSRTWPPIMPPRPAARAKASTSCANGGIFMGCGIRRHIEGVGQKSIADEDRRGLTESLMGGGPSASQIVIVERGKIVMDKRIAMNHFERSGSPHDAFPPGAEQPCRLNGEEWPEPLAPAEACVTHGLKKPRRPEGLSGEGGGRKQGVEHSLRDVRYIEQSRFESTDCLRADRHVPPPSFDRG